MPDTLQPTAKQIIEWLQSQLGYHLDDHEKPLFFEIPFACGSTENGFYSDYAIDFSALEREMDAWINSTFKPTSEAGE